MRSVLILSSPQRQAISKASRNWATVWRRPIACSTSSRRVCGLMLTRVAPAARMARSLSMVTVSGRPASTVYSRKWEKSKLLSTARNSVVSCSADRVVGVPPPKYTVSSRRPSALAISPVRAISCASSSTYRGTRRFAFSTVWDTKEQ